MLVLSRKAGERIVIAGGITVTVVEIIAGRVTIGVDAPREVDVHREEVARAIEREGRRRACPAA